MGKMWITKARNPVESGARQNISSKDRAKGLPAWLADGAKFGGPRYSLTSCSGMCPAILEPQRIVS